MLETAYNLRGISPNFENLLKMSQYWNASEKCIKTNTIVPSWGAMNQQAEQEY
jgi:hypothetical protein